MTFIPRAQEIYKHFKGNLYQIVTLAEHSESGEVLVVYQALYGDFKVYARPLSMFVEKVDKEKYPDVVQEYRFERQELTWTVSAQEMSGAEAASDVAETWKPMITGTMVGVDAEMQGDTDTVQVESKAATVSGASDVSDADEEPQLDPLLLDFLDANTYEERLNILAALHHRITDDMITTMAIVCDVEVKEGDVETRYAELKNCLLTLDKYEITRLH